MLKKFYTHECIYLLETSCLLAEQLFAATLTFDAPLILIPQLLGLFIILNQGYYYKKFHNSGKENGIVRYLGRLI